MSNNTYQPLTSSRVGGALLDFWHSQDPGERLVFDGLWVPRNDKVYRNFSDLFFDAIQLTTEGHGRAMRLFEEESRFLSEQEVLTGEPEA